MKNLTDMNPAEIEEMRERVGRFTKKELGAPPGVWRLHEDAFAPDRAMVKEIECVKCPGPGCKKWLPIDEIGDSTFCCTECFDNYDKERVEYRRLELLHEREEERCKTQKLLG